MLRFVKCLVIVATLGFVCSGVAHAANTPINLGASTQQVTFTAATTPDTTVSVQLGSCVGNICTLSGTATDSSSGFVGTYTFTTDTTGGQVTANYPENGSVYGASMNGATTTFQYTNNNGGGTPDSLTGTVVWTAINDGSPNPTLKGVLTITNVSGPSAFTSLFAGITTVQIDFTLSSMPCGSGDTSNCTLTEMFTTGNGATNGETISAGQIVTPEPGTLALFGSGLLTLGGFLRRRKIG